MFEQIVIDSGVAVKWFVKEPDSEIARLLLKKHLSGECEFSAPDLIYSEIGNILWKKVQFEGFNEPDVFDVIESFKEVPIQTFSASSLFDSAFTKAVNLKRTFYDSLYLALQELLDCDFVTADKRLYNSVSSSLPNIVLLSNWQG